MNISDLSSSWKEENNKLVREFGFNNFLQAMKFVNDIAGIAEKEEHHPDIYISYNKVKLSLSTHDANGITEKDYSLARKIDELSK